MSRKHSKSTPPDAEDRDFRADVLEAVQSLGWLLPETEQEIAAEEENAPQGPSALPPNLADPYAVLDGTAPLRTNRFVGEEASNQQVEEELARAAREGVGEISADIEQRMKRDREAVERVRVFTDDK